MKKPRAAFNMNAAEFFADFFMVPIYIICMMHYNDASIVMMIALVLCGVLLWTLFEYFMHRFLFHNTRLFKEQHDDHHRKPKDLVGNAPWMTLIGTIVVWGLLWTLAGADAASSLTSGVLIGYLIYSTIHINLHHGNPKTFHRILAHLHRHHSAHHRGGTTNFGVTVDWWDRIFRTHTTV